MRIFLAGAAGAIGRSLTPLLVRAGHEVTGTTRSADRAAWLEGAGAKPVVLDVFDAAAVQAAVFAARPEVLIHQLTDLPQRLDPARLAEALERNARLRVEGTRNLVTAGRAAGIQRLIAQSICFVYAPGPEPHLEADPLNLAATGAEAVSVRGVAALERLVTETPGFGGLVLRYGRLYGPGTWSEAPHGPAPVHVDAAAEAALLAIRNGRPGIYNIAEDDGAVSIERARRELGWNPAFRLPAA